MPGIVGLITAKPAELAEAELDQMLSAMAHEPFYRVGMWTDSRTGVYVGWTVREESFADGMPLQNAHGDALVFSGEDFSDKTSNRPDYLMDRAVADPAFPANLNGRFHGLFLDRGRGSVTLFNDRYGLHRLYYHQSDSTFYFAAEAKAILEVRRELRSPDARSLGEFVSCGCVLENRTIFKDVGVLPAGSRWRFRSGALEHEGTYFEPREWEEQTALEPEDYYRELRSVFSSRLPRYLHRHEPVAMSLTGGLDTRMIMAWGNPSAGSLPCYSFGGTYRESQDVRIARKIARACGQPFQVIPVGREFQSRFSDYAERTIFLTDGTLQVDHTADLYLNEKARAIAPARLTGNYGGEVLRRVRAFKPVEPAEGLFTPDFLAHVHASRATYAATLDTHPLSFAVFRQAPWHHYGLLALEETQLSLRSPYLDNEFVKTAFRAPASALSSNDACMRLISDGNSALLNIRTDRGLAGNGGRLRTSAHHKIQEFTFKAEYAYDYGMPQWMAGIDRVLAPLQPERLFLGRHKFCHFRVWYRDVLGDYVQQMLLDSRTLSRPYLQRSFVEAIVRGHIAGRRNYTSEIHKLLTLELIHRLFLDGSAARINRSDRLRSRRTVNTPPPQQNRGGNERDVPGSAHVAR